MRTMFAYDCSGSTGGCKEYHNVAQRIIKSLPPDTLIVAWDSEFKTITRAELDKINAGCKGFNGTDPVEIVKACRQKTFDGHLVILTDGQVSSSDVDKADAEIRAAKMKFGQVSVHIADSRPDVSVSAPFTRNCTFEVKQYPTGNIDGSTVSAVTERDLAVMDAVGDIKTEEQFLAAYPSLEAVVQAATIGTQGSPTMRDSLLKARDRIVKHKAEMKAKQMAEMKVAENETAKAVFLDMISAGDFAAAEAEMRQMHQAYYGPEVGGPSEFEGKMSTLINMCEGGLRSSFDLGAIAAQRAARASMAHEVQATELPDESTEISEEDKKKCPLLECPITLGEGRDMVLLIKTWDKPLLSMLDTQAANRVINNPLNALMYDEFVAAIRNQLDHYISLEAYKGLVSESSEGLTSPLTRAPIAGALAFGANVQHAKATDWMLANLFGGGKLLGNIDLWYAVIWLIAAGDPESSAAEESGLPWLKDLLPLMESHLRWRLVIRTTYASLCGLSQYLCIKIPLGAAVWYVLHSCLLNPSTSADPLRAHLPNVKYLVRILNAGNYSIDPRIKPHLARSQVLMQMLALVKKQSSTDLCTRYEHYRLLIAALHRNYDTIDCETMSSAVRTVERPVPLVLRDGEATAKSVKPICCCYQICYHLLPITFKKLSVAELVGLFDMVHPNKSASDIVLPWNWSAPALDKPAIEWKRYSGPNAKELAMYKVAVCPTTCRPYMTVRNPRGNMVNWSDEAYRVYGPLCELVSCHKWVGEYVSKFKEYPTVDSLVAFIWNRLVVYGVRTCLPADIRLMCETVLGDHAAIMREINASEFSRRYVASCRFVDRERIETAHMESKDIKS